MSKIRLFLEIFKLLIFLAVAILFSFFRHKIQLDPTLKVVMITTFYILTLAKGISLYFKYRKLHSR